MKLRKVRAHDSLAFEAAIRHLRDARDWLRSAGAKKSAAYVARALKSTEGAQRHFRRCLFDADWKAARAANEGKRADA